MLQKFAGEGLRTLCLATRDLDEDYFNNWKQRHQEAALALDNREERLDAIYEEIEMDMSLIGVTAIEDKLQDGVPLTIANLILAGIKIWVLTGDKQGKQISSTLLLKISIPHSLTETAINIGYSCQLLTDEMIDVFIVDASSYDEVHEQLMKFKDSIKIVKTFQPRSPPVEIGAVGTSNGRVDASDHSTGTSTPPHPTPAPPAVSVVTFRWDDTIVPCENQRAR